MTAPLPDAAPYDPDKLVPPLSSVQKTNMIRWMVLELVKHPNFSYDIPKTTTGDAELIARYKEVVVLAGLKMPGLQNPLTAISDTTLGHFLGALMNGQTWVRVAEFGVGILLLGVAVNAALKGNSGYDKVAGGVRNGSKKVGLLTPAGKAARDNALYEDTLRRGTRRMTVENQYARQQTATRRIAVQRNELKARDLSAGKKLNKLLEP